MKVSVVIPTYNRRELLRECLASILSQTRLPDEVIVVDDGSTDDTDMMVAAHFPMVRCLRIVNSGVVAARIAGIAQASYEWIALCDSDDIWQPEFLCTRMRLLEQHPDCLFSFGNFRLYDGRRVESGSKFDDAPTGYWKRFGQSDPSSEALVAQEPPYGLLVRFQPVFPSTIVLHRSLYDRIGGFDIRLSRTMSEDFEFTLRCAEFAPVMADLNAHVLIRKHSGNASGDVGMMVVGDIGILKFARSHHRSAAAYADAIAEEISIRSKQAAEMFFCCGDLQRFRQLAREVAPRHRSFKWRIKRLIGAAPAPIATALMRRLAGDGQSGLTRVNEAA